MKLELNLANVHAENEALVRVRTIDNDECDELVLDCSYFADYADNDVTKRVLDATLTVIRQKRNYWKSIQLRNIAVISQQCSITILTTLFEMRFGRLVLSAAASRSNFNATWGDACWEIIQSGIENNMGPHSMFWVSCPGLVVEGAAYLASRNSGIGVGQRFKEFYLNYTERMTSEVAWNLSRAFAAWRLEVLDLTFPSAAEDPVNRHFLLEEGGVVTQSAATLKSLHLTGHTQVTSAANCLRLCTNLESLRLQLVCSNEADATAFVHVLQNHPSLKKWSVHTSLGEFTNAILQPALSTAGTTPSQLEVFHCSRDEKIFPIAEALKSPTCRLKYLSVKLRPSPSFQQSRHLLLEAVRQNCYLETVDNHPPVLNRMIPPEILYFCMLNRCGRRLLRPAERGQLPPTNLWPLIFQKIDRTFQEYQLQNEETYSKEGWLYELFRGPFLDQIMVELGSFSKNI